MKGGDLWYVNYFLMTSAIIAFIRNLLLSWQPYVTRLTLDKTLFNYSLFIHFALIRGEVPVILIQGQGIGVISFSFSYLVDI